MHWILAAVVSSVLTFIPTNLDDLVILATLFAEPSLRPQKVVIGQFIGFATLVALSALGASGALLFPRQWIGALGLVPLGLGVRAIVRARRGEREPKDPASPPPAPRSERLGGILSPQIAQVALITIGNGGDNIGVYVPLFASAGHARMLVVVLVYFLLLGVWCWLGYRLVRRATLAKALVRHGHIVTPIVFLGLGVYILLTSGLVPYLRDRLG